MKRLNGTEERQKKKVAGTVRGTVISWVVKGNKKNKLKINLNDKTLWGNLHSGYRNLKGTEEEDSVDCMVKESGMAEPQCIKEDFEEAQEWGRELIKNRYKAGHRK